MPRINDPAPPLEGPKPPLTRAQKAIIAIAVSTAIATPLATEFEGFRGKAYYDPAHILTQCYGETKDIDPSLIYSQTQCAAKLRSRLAKDYAPVILKCVPSFIEPANFQEFGAALDASYNAGPGAVCKSPMAAAFNAGNYKLGCDRFPGWRTTAKNRVTGVRVVYPGLERRRKVERVVCLTKERG